MQNVQKLKLPSSVIFLHHHHKPPPFETQKKTKNKTQQTSTSLRYFFRVVGLGEVARSVHHYHLSSQVKIEIPQPTPPKKILLHPHPAFFALGFCAALADYFLSLKFESVEKQGL